MGDFFAHDLGLGHVTGLPLLALALLMVVVSERFNRISIRRITLLDRHQSAVQYRVRKDVAQTRNVRTS